VENRFSSVEKGSLDKDDNNDNSGSNKKWYRAEKIVSTKVEGDTKLFLVKWSNKKI